jgi:hypothetical protein
MSKDYLKVKLGGKERGLKFNVGTLYHIGELTGGNPLQGNTYQQTFSALKHIVYAALLSNCDCKEVEPDFDEKEVTGWVKLMTPAEAKQITLLYNEVFEIDVAGEGNKNTQ